MTVMAHSRALRLLVIEGNRAEDRARHAAVTGATPGDYYAEVLRSLAPGAVVDICCPADPGANLPDSGGLASYDGVAITGSALNIYKGEAASLNQIELARAVFDAGVPFFGSCWGLQVASVAAGGSVRPNPKGREIGVARKIVLTEAGRDHLLHDGRDRVFDAAAIHLDEVEARPERMTVTAANGFSDVQAAEIRHGAGTFWGVQYHPEYTLGELAAIIGRNAAKLMSEGFFDTIEDGERYVADLRLLAAEPARTDIAWRLGIDADLTDPARRLTELRNWLDHQVKPRRGG